MSFHPDVAVGQQCSAAAQRERTAAATSFVATRSQPPTRIDITQVESGGKGEGRRAVHCNTSNNSEQQLKGQR